MLQMPLNADDALPVIRAMILLYNYMFLSYKYFRLFIKIQYGTINGMGALWLQTTETKRR